MNRGFNAMGKPIPECRLQAAYDEAKTMGIDSPEERMNLVNAVAKKLEHDKPFDAQQVAIKHLDLTGSYRLIACLLA